MRHIVVLCLFMFLFALPSGAEETPTCSIVDGKIGASLIRVAVPAKWNRDVLILAHGLRAADWPLTAEFSTNGALFESLSGEGWMIAATSYRRNGWIMAVDDIGELRTHIVDTYGEPKRVFLLGGSMGAAIVTRLAETHPQDYAGALAVGQVGAADYDYGPQVPLLLLSNRNEAGTPRQYVAKAASAKVRPAFWSVDRDGHCNTTGEEELQAFRAVVKWTETGEIARDADGTIIPPPPVSAAVFGDGLAKAKVTHMASGKGSLDTEFTAEDMRRLGIAPRSRFTATCNEHVVEILYGTTYSDVPRGGWVAFIVADGGHLRLARNFADAVTELGCGLGDEVSIKPLQGGEE